MDFGYIWLWLYKKDHYWYERPRMSSMDVYKICALFGCESCNGVDTPSYDASTHQNYMRKVGHMEKIL